MHFTTVSSVQENQVAPSKDLKKIDGGWSWSQPEAAPSVFSETQHPLQPVNFASSYYPQPPGQNFNHNEGTSQRMEYFPYPYEVGSAGGDIHHVSAAHNTENALGSITKHFATVSFIGLLLLFAIVQNSISASTRKDALVDVRKKRDVIGLNELNPMVLKKQNITIQIVHYQKIIHAFYCTVFRYSIFQTPEQKDVLSEDAKIRCMQRLLCLENQKLRKHLGVTGKKLAKYLTRTVKNSVKKSFGWGRLLEDAGQAGLRGEDCRILYRDCTA
ncbi:uncharacterized protein LOC112694991 isoform X2 [Athalia rosae]|nr:uncharacterized protein LOC112694991 isoform X2 [Athalia rosae]